MEIDLAQLPDWVITTLIALFAALFVYWRRQAFGLGETQVATKAEQQKVIDLQERQIELLQDEVRTLRRRVDHLENVVSDYQLQVRILRESREEEEHG